MHLAFSFHIFNTYTYLPTWIFSRHFPMAAGMEIFLPLLTIYFKLCCLGSSEAHFHTVTFESCLRVKGIQDKSFVMRDYSNTSRYAHLNHQWNTLTEYKYPLGFFLPKSTQDVQIAVKCGRKTNTHLVAKSGGHSEEAFSFGDSEKVVIDFRQMSKIIVHRKSQTATIGPGALVGEILAKTWKYGLGLPTGLDYYVGIGGHALGGGFGYFSSKYGLVLDNILEITMVDARGHSRTVDDCHNPDLFWGLRGVGSGYIGIVTSFKFQLFSTTNIVVHYLELNFNVEDIEPVFLGWQGWLTWSRRNEPSIKSLMTILGANRIQLQVTLIHELSAKSEYLLPKLKMYFPEPENVTDAYMSTLDLMIQYGIKDPDLNPPPQITLQYLKSVRQHKTDRLYNKDKSFFVDKTFTKEELKGVLKVIVPPPSVAAYVVLVGVGGVEASVAPSAMAYVHRKSLYFMTIHANSPGSEVNSWVRTLLRATQFMDNGESYQNYVDSELDENGEFLKRYYGSNLEKLLILKRKWDPTNYFRNSQSLPVV